MEIKRLRGDSPSDIFEAMSALDKECFGSEGWSAESFRTEAEKDGGIVLAAYCGDSLAGLFAGFTAGDTGEVLTLAVTPEYRRQGVSRALLSEFLSLVPDEAETIALEVRQSNSAAIALYESFGFRKAGVRKRFYKFPVIEDADIMIKNMKESVG